MNVQRPNPQPQTTEQDSKTLERNYRAAVSTVYALDVRLSVATALLRDVKAERRCRQSWSAGSPSSFEVMRESVPSRCCDLNK